MHNISLSNTGTNTVGNPASCIPSSSSSCGSQNTNPSPGELPGWAKYDAHLGTCTGSDCTGGYSHSMDFVPVRLGYWNCLDAKPESTSSMTTIGNGTEVDTDETFGSLSDELELFGGQTHCENCRCFESTLREIGSIKQLEYATYGLCYVSNCYRSDYLQVGIRERGGGITWYVVFERTCLYISHSHENISAIINLYYKENHSNTNT